MMLKNSTPAVQYSAFECFAQLRLTRSRPILSAHHTYAKLRLISLDFQRF